MSWVMYDPGHADLPRVRYVENKSILRFALFAPTPRLGRACMSWVTRDPGHADLLLVRHVNKPMDFFIVAPFLSGPRRGKGSHVLGHV